MFGQLHHSTASKHNIMASICLTCSESIMGPEFIKCEGLCCQLFHTKCVGVNKSTLNAITSNSNVHWYCNACNNERVDVSSSINNLKQSMDQLTSSLASNLSKFTSGFTSLSENLIANIASQSNVDNIQRVSEIRINANNKRQRDESSDTTSLIMPKKRIILGSNSRDRSIAAVDNAERNIGNQNRRKSVVVSNISQTITAEYLTTYLATELNVAKESVRVTLISNCSSRFNALQYRVSAPECNFNALMSSETWPNSVRVREYIFKSRNNGGVPISNFLEKQSINQRHDPLISTATSNIQSTLPTPPVTQVVETQEMEMDLLNQSALIE